MEKGDQSDAGETPPPPRDTANDSFVKKVTTRVTELIPDTLTRWFTSRRQLIRRRDSSSDDDDNSKQSPPKRTRLSSDRYSSLSRPPLENSTGEFHPVDALEPAEKSDARFLRLYESMRRRDNSAESSRSGSFDDPTAGTSGVCIRKTVIESNGAEKSESEDSTSGCSSMAQKNRDEKKPECSFERSLFSKSTSRPSSSLSSRRPSFDASSFGSPSLVDRTLTSERIAASPFYDGRTRYGGALSLRPTIRRPVKPRETIDVRVSKANDLVELSKTARRILDTLERISSPIDDIRNMPRPNVRGPPIRPLNVPVVQDPLVAELRKSTEYARNIASKPEYKLRRDEGVARRSNKIRAKVTKLRAERGADEISERFDLPEVSLKIDKMPEIDILPKKSEYESKKLECLLKKSEYEFSAPKTVAGRARSYAIAENFKFSKPIVLEIEKISPLARRPISSIEKLSPKIRLENRTVGWECEVCLIRNLTDVTECAACKAKMPVRENERTELDNKQPEAEISVSKNEKVESKPETVGSGFGDAFKPPPDTWLCDVCLVRNKPESLRCVACETAKPGAPPKPVAKKAPEWECPTCLVRNSVEKNECVCCTTPAPGRKTTKLEIPGAPPPGTFKFGIDAADVPNVTVEIPKGFVFGNASGTAPVDGFTFGIPPKENDKDKSKRVGKLELVLSTEESDFGTPDDNTSLSDEKNIESPERIIEPVPSEPVVSEPMPVEKTDTAIETVASSTPVTSFIAPKITEPTSGTSKLTESSFGTSSQDKQVEKLNTSKVSPLKAIAFEKPAFGSDKPVIFGKTSSIENATDKPIIFGAIEKHKTGGPFEKHVFGTSAPTEPVIFGTAAPTFTAANAPAFGVSASFGSSAEPRPSTNGFAFGEKKTPPAFSFGAEGSTPAKVPAFAFSAPGPFDASKTLPSFSFGTDSARKSTFGGAAPAFDFRPAETFAFGGSRRIPTTSNFTFGTAPPAFDPNTKPVFNFSGNSTPTAFTAQPAAGTTPVAAQRRVKRAVRRTQR